MSYLSTACRTDVATSHDIAALKRELEHLHQRELERLQRTLKTDFEGMLRQEHDRMWTFTMFAQCLTVLVVILIAYRVGALVASP